VATNLLRQAFDKASELAENGQDVLAHFLIQAIESDARLWDAAFARSVKKLDKLAEQALEDHRVGRTEPLDPDKL